MVVSSSLALHTVLLVPLSGTRGPVVHPHGLTGSAKAACKSRPGHLQSYTWCVWIVPECSFNVAIAVIWISPLCL